MLDPICRTCEQYVDYIEEQDFWTYIQWLNPGYHDVDAQYFEFSWVDQSPSINGCNRSDTFGER